MSIFSFMFSNKKKESNEEIINIKNNEEINQIEENSNISIENKDRDLEYIEKYYEDKITMYCHMLTNEKAENVNNYIINSSLYENFFYMINFIEEEQFKIKDKNELLDILDIFFRNNKDFIELKEYIINFIKEEFNFKLVTKEEFNERENSNKNLKDLRKLIYNNFISTKSNKFDEELSWLMLCHNKKLTKEELINNLTIALLERNFKDDDINNLIIETKLKLNFFEIPSNDDIEIYKKYSTKDMNLIENNIDFLNDIKNSNRHDKNYIKEFSKYFLEKLSYFSNTSITEILNNYKEDISNLFTNKDIISFEEVINLETKFTDYNDLLKLKKYLPNWKQIKINQINKTDEISNSSKIDCFKQIEEDFSNLSNNLNSDISTISNILDVINSRDYIKLLNINTTEVMMNYLSTDYFFNKKYNNTNNSIELELRNIRRWQENVSNLKKY